MEIYKVGGAVRDILMGVNPKDNDYVVVGSTSDEMISAGFQQVGADFPVFLHPETKDEYALARTEEKTGPGYHGFETRFDPSVTLEEDQSRRDLTINSMAMDDKGNMFDPHDGAFDIAFKTLRHTTDAFREDPVRVLRVARFHARFGPEWSIAEKTKLLCWKMVQDGELDSLTQERVFKEFEKAMMEDHPHLFFEFLLEVGALKVIFPEIHALDGVKENTKYHPEGDAFAHTMLVLQQAARLKMGFIPRLAALVHDFGKALTPEELEKDGKHHNHEVTGATPVTSFCDRLNVGATVTKRMVKLTRYHMHMHKLDNLSAKGWVKMFTELDCNRDSNIITLLYVLGVCDERGRQGNENAPVDQLVKVVEASKAFKAVTFGDVFPGPKPKSGEAIQQGLHRARVDAMKEWMQ